MLLFYLQCKIQYMSKYQYIIVVENQSFNCELIRMIIQNEKKHSDA